VPKKEITRQMTMMATDPVCGMQVNREIAVAQALTSDLDGETYYFCGTGCKLDFDENPARILDPSYQPHM
jgi:YHS domain-containing protein